MHIQQTYCRNIKKERSVRAFSHLAEVVRQVVNAETVTPSTGNPISQDIGTSAWWVQGRSRQDAKDLVNITTNVVGESSLANLPAEIEPDTAAYDAEYVSAFNTITEVKPTLQSGVITYLSREWNGLGYDQG